MTKHTVKTTASGEYSCSCGAVWDRDEGDECPASKPTGCTFCGSDEHMTAVCPMRIDEQAREIERLRSYEGEWERLLNDQARELAALKAQPSGVVLPEPMKIPQPGDCSDGALEEKRSEARGFNMALHAVANLSHVYFNAHTACGRCFGAGKRAIGGVAIICTGCNGRGFVGDRLEVARLNSSTASAGVVDERAAQVPRKALADFIEYSVPGPYDCDEKWFADKRALVAALTASAPVVEPAYETCNGKACGWCKEGSEPCQFTEEQRKARATVSAPNHSEQVLVTFPTVKDCMRIAGYDIFHGRISFENGQLDRFVDLISDRAIQIHGDMTAQLMANQRRSS